MPDSWSFVRLKELWELVSGRDLSSAEYNVIIMAFLILLAQAILKMVM